ncbi:hypothetical protein [Microbulbifer epialgicus]|uniref:Ricin B lectin domain-containing protein n=1 Tax=Microbulbifer epialgicus TaxID=393907 RepID=A0ABV4P6X7_9GAMM
MITKLKSAGVCLSLMMGFVFSQAEASPLTGACYDYASRPATSAVSYDIESVAILLANNAITTALAQADVSGTLRTLYPFVYSAVKGGIVEEGSNGSDPEIVSCLEEFNERINAIEGKFLTDELADLKSIIDAAKLNIKAGRPSYHLTAANEFNELATKIGVRILDRLKEIDDGTTTNGTYDGITEIIPGFITAIQMEYLHRAEFDRYCYSLDAFPYWNGLDVDEQVPYSILLSIYNNEDQGGGILDWLTRPDSDSKNCDLGYSSFHTYQNVLDQNKSGTYGEVLKAVGININETPFASGLISTSVDFANSRLTKYRESLITQCKDGKFRDEYTGRELDPNDCESSRNSYLTESIRTDSVFSEGEETKRMLLDMAFIVDTWDLSNLIEPQFNALNRVIHPETYNSVRLKHGPSNLCVDYYGIVNAYCDTGESVFVFRPYQDGYLISHPGENRNFKDKGAGIGLTYLEGEGAVATWYVSTQNSLGLSEIRNKYTNNCLIVDDSLRLAVAGCDANSQVWDIGGGTIPTPNSSGLFVRLRDVESNVCVGAACDENRYEFHIIEYNGGYLVTNVYTGQNLKDRDWGIDILTGLGHVATWYFVDSDHNGLFELRNKSTDKCLASNGTGLIAETCDSGAGSEIWKLDTVHIPTGDYIDLSVKSGISTLGWCLSRHYTQGYQMGACGPLSSTVLYEHDGGYLIKDVSAGTYMKDIGLGFGGDSLMPSQEVSEYTTWDFYGPYQDGTYKVRNRGTGQCLRAHDASGGRAIVAQLDCADSASINWIRMADK